MKLFPDENIIQESDKGSIVLTTHRIYQEEKKFGSHNTKSIMLEHITSCETKKINYYRYLILSLFGIIIALIGNGDDFIFLSFILFLLGLLLFYITKKSLINIASPTSTIVVNAKKLKRRNINDFVDMIENAKHKRLLQVGNLNK